MTDQQRFRRVESIFSELLEIAPADRPAALDRACADDEALKREVASLLTAHAGAGRFLAEPATGGLAALADLPGQPDAGVGRRFGAYEAIERIGAGGMGAVYRARRRDDQFEKQVAIKVIHWWLDTSEILRRFERERRVLARLQHPNIAMLLDAGVTDDGAPYIVMEHVDGRPIDQHCACLNLSVDERLALFLSACDAVQAAHNNLIVHLDLKPGNILVTGDGLVKLVDFGIARLLESDSTDPAAPVTRTDRRAFTPAYAAPEQITGGPLTTSTDVYALGVILYELLTGVRPFRSGDDPSPSIEHEIRNTVPPAPSTAVATAATAPGADPRHARRLGRRLAGDLDNIALMAMRKEPQRRYHSVKALADDVRRHLANATVLARPDTFSYRASRFLRRNRVPVAAAAAVFLALLAGLVAVTWQAQETAAQRDRAQRRFGDLRALTNSLIADVDQNLANLPGATEARRAIVTQAVAYLDSLAAEAGEEPGLLAELASSYSQLGQLQRSFVGDDLGDTAAAIESHRKALALRERVLAARPDSAETHKSVAESHVLIGDMLRSQGDVAGASDHYRTSERHYAVTQGLTGNDLLDRLHHRAVILIKLGIVESSRGHYDEAAAAYEEALAVNRSVLSQDPSRTVTRRNTAVTLEKLGDVAEARGDAQSAHDHYRQALAIYSDIADANPADVSHVFTVIIAHSKLGEVLGHPSYTNLGDVDGALREYREGRRLISELQRIDPANARARSMAAHFDRRLGTFLTLKGEYDEALRHHRAALDTAEQLVHQNPTDLAALADVASCALTISDTYDSADRDAEALRWMLRAIDAHEALLRINPEHVVARLGLARAYRSAGDRSADLAEAAATPQTRAQHYTESCKWLERAVHAYTALSDDGALRAANEGDLEGAAERLDEVRRAAAEASFTPPVSATAG